MKILLAGGGGYIGSSLAPALLEKGYEVDVIDLFWFGNHLPERVKAIKKNLFDCIEKDLEGYDSVVFLGGLSNDPMAEFNPAQNFVYNAAHPVYLAYIAKKAGAKRFVYASSCSVYGYTQDRLYDEDPGATCGYPYGISKLQGELGCSQLRDDDFSVIGLRQGTVCGWSSRMRFDLIVNTMYKSAMTEGKITVNNPAIWRPILDIRDAIHAFILAIEAPPAITGTFNVASGNYTVGEVANSVKEEIKALTGKEIGLVIKNIPDLRNYRASTDKAQNVLGFMPKHSIADTVRHLHNNLGQFDDFENEAYYNIRVFKNLSF
ncbi:MAG: NAD(P)-dependent oxidoreductase [Candidatus Brennerbacteria bacterium]